jgi:PEP-CTERM motif-containing protein
MNRNILWIFLVVAPLVSASSLGTFKASCSFNGFSGGCGGDYQNGTDEFAFGGPFPGSADRYAPGQGTPYIEFGVGTNGGSFSFQGNSCDYSVQLGGFPCDGDVSFGTGMAPPDDTGLSRGDVVTIAGTGRAQGFWCWGDGCMMGAQLFDLDVTGTYQFTLTDPGTPTPFSWTGAEFSSVPEPGTGAFVILGLAGVATRFRRRRDRPARS